jgi:hypothetical protein
MNRIPSILLLLLLPLLASATSIFDLLVTAAGDAPVKMTLTVPMDSILAKVNTKQEAGISFVDNKGQAQVWDLGVSVRGKFRRNRCDYAPLKLNFSKKDLKAIGLESFDKYKLVTPCTDDPNAGDLVLKEYLAYKAYGMITDLSFRVQLLEITYHDANGVHPDRTETAFLIESTKEMATRIGGKELDNPLGLPAEAYDAKAEATHALLQYLVGNGDFSLPLACNLKVIEMADGKMVPVGYDFDFTGWVGAPYASPTSEVGQTSIYERVYLGYVHDDNLLREVATNFREHRKEILSLINRSSINEVDQEVLWRFASRFFGQLNKMNNKGDLLLYDQLRGATAEVIPPGAEADSFKSIGK